jgi:hypothetical protein
MLAQSDPQRAKRLLEQAQETVVDRWRKYKHMASLVFDPGAGAGAGYEGTG